ncbi:cysteine--tRNA ligase [Peptococcaceae bacterium CEB3]|nr:cysteine--tRNA ligase [Peptococcaceae bacterium CEB3]
MAMYACGPTTYNFIHMGNARMLVVFDMVRRYLMYKGYEVRYVQNFTDVDDKIIQRAREEGIPPATLAEKYIREYFHDAEALGILPATIHPKATEHIPEMVRMIQGLVEHGLAYVVEGDVYFAVDRFPAYGKLSGRGLDDMLAGARVEVDERKHHPMDFALWKKAKEGEPAWESPWGLGRPGWHIECSAMSLKYLGAGFDIHGGGGDLVFPHHENEIAQSEGYLQGGIFARYWMHNAFITVNKAKMSKSLGNFFTVREVLEHFPGEVLRFYLLETHYRSPLDFDDEKLILAQKGLERLHTSVRLAGEVLEGGIGSQVPEPGVRTSAEARLRPEERVQARAGVQGASGGETEIEGRAAAEVLQVAVEEARDAFVDAMDDDFNSALGLAALFELAKAVNSHVGMYPYRSAELAAGRSTLLELAGVLGFDLAGPVEKVEESDRLSGVMEVLLQVRDRARARKDWETADFIRTELKNVGIILEDTPQGARWQVK